MARVKKTETCWLWVGSALPNGYGKFSANEYAHRVSHELFKGPIPEGLTIDHLCRVPRCVNPAHLEAVTARENVLRGEGVAAENAKKSTCPRGHALVPKGRGRWCRECPRVTAQRQTAQRKRDRPAKQAAGICTWCARPAVQGRRACVRCSVKRGEAVARRRAAALVK